MCAVMWKLTTAYATAYMTAYGAPSGLGKEMEGKVWLGDYGLHDSLRDGLHDGLGKGMEGKVRLG